MPRRTKEEAEQTRRALMEAALTLFGEQGYTSTTLADITRRAGVTKGAFYWHFKGKADVFLSLVDKLQAPLDKVFEAAFHAEGTPAQRLHNAHVAVLTAFESDERVRLIFEIIFLKVEHSPEAEPIHERERLTVEGHIAEVVPVVREAIRAGEFRSDLDPELAARAMLANTMGLMRHWIVDPSRFSLRDQADELVTMFMRGLRA